MENGERPNKRRRLSDERRAEPTQIRDWRDEAQRPSRLSKKKSNVKSNQTSGSAQGTNHDNGDAEDTGEGASKSVDQNDLPAPDKAAPLAASTNDEEAKPMSKNQQKKLRKQQEWESKREDRKIIRKQKLVAKRERKRAARDQALENGEPLPTQPKPPQKHVLLPITILIDCDFDDLMRDPERKSLAAQVTRSYSDNRKAPFQAHLAVCSFGGQLRERFETVLTHYKSWRGIRFLDCDFVEAGEKAKEWMSDSGKGGKIDGVFSKPPTSESSIPDLQAKGEVVYLTSESPDTLEQLKPFSTYIIGGLVDKNREKGICFKRAQERGIRTARLPIGEFMEMQSRKVLATNHVNEIMVRWLECGDWGEAFTRVIPKRKGGRLREVGGEEEEEEGEEGEEEEEGDVEGVKDPDEETGDVEGLEEKGDAEGRVEEANDGFGDDEEPLEKGGLPESKAES